MKVILLIHQCQFQVPCPPLQWQPANLFSRSTLLNDIYFYHVINQNHLWVDFYGNVWSLESRCPPQQLIHFYTAVIRPVLEYASPVWHYSITRIPNTMAVLLSLCYNTFYRAMHFSAYARSWDRMSVRPSVRPSVTLVDCDHIGGKSWKLITRTTSPTPSLFVAKRRST